ncbi:MAG: metal ABC transporter permease, partial [Roseinatronobacter sp.]|nr:metal ABC transporter permease [Roseinatronobacter sp.]
FAVLRRQSLLGDALAHAALPGICLGFILAGARDLSSILAGAFATGALAALAMMLIIRRSTLKTDAALGIVLSVFFAVGVVLLTFVQGQGNAASAGLATFLFGQAAAILRADLWVMAGVGLAALGVVLALWKEFKLVSFDPEFARVQGLPVFWLEAALTVLVALAIVMGLQLVGVVLMVALLIAPAAAARHCPRPRGPRVGLAALCGAAAGAGGALVRAHVRGLATGPVVVLIATGFVVISLLAAPGRGVIWQALAARKARARISDSRVLSTLHGLATAHHNMRYPAEGGMLKTALGAMPRAAHLAGLEARGLIRTVTHPPETTPHWELTRKGHVEAARLEDKLDDGQNRAENRPADAAKGARP